MAGLYIHIPFCAGKCAYCDFASYAGREGDIDAYISALSAEARSYSGLCADSVFLGGGTPSLLSPQQFARLMGEISRYISIKKNCEFTVEANPETVSQKKAQAWRAAGANRLSMGLQATQKELLKILGRRHDAQDFIRAEAAARAAGFLNISADLMMGLPAQTAQDAREAAGFAAHLAHVSVYMLKIEEGTPLARRFAAGELPPLGDGLDCFYAAAEVLRAAGHARYEISNFARPGAECAHNLKYWRREEYIGLGAAAHSFYNEERFYNVSGIDEYIERMNAQGSACAGRESVAGEAGFENIMLKTRLAEGIEIEVLKPGYERLIEAGLAELRAGRLCLTDRGMNVQNAVVLELA